MTQTIIPPTWVGNKEIFLKDYIEFRLDQQTRTMSIQVRFNPSHVFILNQTEATLYLQRGGLQTPDALGADLVIQPNSFYNFKPVFGGYYYGANLVFPPGYVPTFPYYQCIIFFVYGEGNFASLFPTPNVIHPLNPLPDPGDLAASFTFEITPNVTQAGFPFQLEFANSDYGFSVVDGKGSYVPGTGFVSADIASWGASINFNTFDNVRGVRITLPIDPPVVFDSLQAFVQYTRASASVPGNAWLSGHIPDSSGSGLSWGSILPDTVLPDPPSQNIFDWQTIPAAAYGEITFEVISSALGTPSYFGTAIITGLIGQAQGDITFPGAIVQFTDTSTGTPVDWLWDFGDGSPTSALQNPLHTYAADGVYTVSLCVQGAFGGIACTTMDVYINTIADEVLEYV